MNILHILDNDFKSDPRVEKEISSLLKNKENHIEVLCLKSSNSSVIEEREYLIHPYLPENIHQYYKLDIKSLLIEINKKVHFDKFNLIHAHDHVSLNLAAKIKSDFPQIKIIYDAHEYIKGWKYYQLENKIINRLKGYIIHQIYIKHESKNIRSAVNEIITVSDGIAALYEKRFKKKVTTVRNVPLKKVIPVENSSVDLNLRHLLRLSSNDVVLVHSGNLYYDVGTIRLLINTIKDLSEEYKLALICSDRDWLKVSQLNDFLAVKDRIYHLNMVPYANLSTLLSTADIGLLLNYKPRWESHWHSLPNRLFDYTNAGLAIVSTTQPEFCRVLDQYKNGLTFNITLKDGLREAIELCKSSLSIFKANSVMTSTVLNWEREESKLLELYKRKNLQ